MRMVCVGMHGGGGGRTSAPDSHEIGARSARLHRECGESSLGDYAAALCAAALLAPFHCQQCHRESDGRAAASFYRVVTLDARSWW